MTKGKTFQEILDRDLHNDPAFRKEWERTCLALELAILVVGYRAEHNLTQEQLAATLGVKQPNEAPCPNGTAGSRDLLECQIQGRDTHAGTLAFT